MCGGRIDQRDVLAREVFLTARGPERGAARAASEIRYLLVRLADGAVVEPDGKGGFQLVDVKANGNPPKPVNRRVVDACRAGDWLLQDGCRFVLTEAARARLRRHGGQGNDAFRVQHQLRKVDLRDVGGARCSVLLNDGESPLGWLRSRKDRSGKPLIGEPQFEAGERLRADYWFARMSQRVTANWSSLAPLERSRRGGPAGGADLRDEVLAAKERVRRALAAVGPEISGVLIDICCELKGLEEAEKQNGWPQRAGKVVLQIALTRLARHYGLIADTGRTRRDMRHWGDTDYRPNIEGEAGEENATRDSET